MKKKIFSSFLILALLFSMFALVSCKDNTKSENPVVEIVVKDYGTITVRLNKNAAPITVDHFVSLCNKHAYDNTSFNRMQKDFVLQGGVGCKDNSTIKGEFKANGVNNTIEHKQGVISMARSNDYNSASSQFFLMLSDKYQSSLDGQYAAFGHITKGFEVVEAICNNITEDDFTSDYYGTTMGFLKESSYITIETIRVVK